MAHCEILSEAETTGRRPRLAPEPALVYEHRQQDQVPLSADRGHVKTTDLAGGPEKQAQEGGSGSHLNIW